ncbi:MAG: hypothetical protein OXS35_09660 [Dehalococcoidia bacterium]|nr:hypothetical protein [Dehalococcoidia bacterium]
MEELFKGVLGGLGQEIAKLWFGLINMSLFKRDRNKRAVPEAPSQTNYFIDSTININSDGNRETELRRAIEARTIQSLEKTLLGLTQHPLGDGHTYADLPDGTRIVMVADGAIHLALPVRLRAAVGAGAVGVSAELTVVNPEPQKPGS